MSLPVAGSIRLTEFAAALATHRSPPASAIADGAASRPGPARYTRSRRPVTVLNSVIRLVARSATQSSLRPAASQSCSLKPASATGSLAMKAPVLALSSVTMPSPALATHSRPWLTASASGMSRPSRRTVTSRLPVRVLYAATVSDPALATHSSGPATASASGPDRGHPVSTRTSAPEPARTCETESPRRLATQIEPPRDASATGSDSRSPDLVTGCSAATSVSVSAAELATHRRPAATVIADGPRKP